MPGRLMMDSQARMESYDVKQPRDHVPSPPIQQDVNKLNAILRRETSRASNPALDTDAPNRDAEQPPNHALTNGTHQDATRPHVGKVSDPPELDGSWRQGEQNKSMGVMMDRLAQQAFFDLNDTLAKMAELGPLSESKQSNGVLPSTFDTSEQSLQRKRLVLDYAKEQRDRFTKALVLSDWSRNEADMARLIDIKVWQDKQRFAHANAKHAVGQIKVDTVGARMPSPNIEAAMELMATGSAASVPDLGYIPPKRLSPLQLLRTLRNMNVVLAARLNLHEKLPYYMRDFSIANGRATFAVPGEFEVDLAVADEEPSSPFYFIDMRFAFSPAPTSLDERIRGFLEGRVNQALASSGLHGCYDFLHNFVLTHKINILKDQALNLARGDWFDCIKTETLRRNLVVQYWCNRPGPKSWIEIGVVGTKPKETRRAPPNPSLSVRCFQKQNRTELDIDFDWNRLNLEKCLLQVISKDSETALISLHDRISRLLQNNKKMFVVLLRDESNAANGINIQVGRIYAPLHCHIEAITGQFVLSPSTTATANAERRLNSESVDPVLLLTTLTCGLVQDIIAREANLLGWTAVHGMSKIDPRPIFGSDVRQRSFYTCSTAWDSSWTLAVTIGLDGINWWIVRITTFQDEKSKTTEKIISAHRQLKTVDPAGKELELNQDELLRVEKLAVAQISFMVLAQDLAIKDAHISHELPDITLQSIKTGQESLSTSIDVRAFFPLARLAGGEIWKSWRAWAEDVVRLTHLGFDEAYNDGENVRGHVRHDVRISLKSGKMTHLRKHLTRGSDHEIAFNEDGGLAIQLSTQFGKPILPHLRDKLRIVQQLDEQVSALHELGYRCSSVNLTRLCFYYNKDLRLAGQIYFAGPDRPSAKLLLEPDTNPHLRIRVLLEQLLNEGLSGPSFRVWARLLTATLPLLETMQRLESVQGAKRAVQLRVRNVSRYSLLFRAPHPPFTVNIILRSKKSGVRRGAVWQIEDATTPAEAEKLPEDFKRALSTLWQEKTDLWFGTGRGLIAFPPGISGAIEKLVDVIKRFELSESDQAVPSIEASSNVVKVEPRPKIEPAAMKAASSFARKQAGTKQDAITLD